MKIVFAFIFVISITSCGSSKKPGEKYPDQVRTNFINGCAGKLPPEYKKNCECMLEQVEKKYSLAGYVQVEKDIKAGKDVSAFIAYTDSVRQICFPKK
jgi:uncharacterized lipoprotein YehR (DUF1307 family)